MNTATAAIIPETKLREVMETNFTTLKSDDSLRVVEELVAKSLANYFPVLDNGRLVGVICAADLLRASVLSPSHPRDKSVCVAWSRLLVKDVMKPVRTVPTETTVYDAASLMVEHAIDCLIVTEDSEISGVVTRTDLLRALDAAVRE
jgi:CBS domain-containing protein